MWGEYNRNRTDFRIVNRNHLGYLEYSRDRVILQQITAPEAFEGFVRLLEGKPDIPVYGIDPDFHAHVLHEYKSAVQRGKKVTNRPATNGFYGIVFALTRCRQVTLFGFARQVRQMTLFESASVTQSGCGSALT
ncbi:hypothetical protein CYMTET_17474 [Cymbomonas tetramitiformis]|uniref:Uncharacterized protein n=1 Tax=Cymbomonas tetramitiformis TaxID=36881 RepID=A0AAE0L6Y2_9CHLO|nr:hypothetical protein CYMTET_17474 [Cymbomonas tetramitiformis]